MYSQQDLDEAVASGAVSADAATSLRSFIDGQRANPSADEEQFRLINSFNDIFVSIASAILLFAVGWIGQSAGQAIGLVIEDRGPSLLGPIAVAATAWGLALFFTARRRMALPSILLLLAFVGGVFAAAGFTLVLVIGEQALNNNQVLGGILAAGAAAVVALVLGLLVSVIGRMDDGVKDIVLGAVLLLGIGVFLFAMRWDSSDQARLTRRSDVAFWLHLLAAPMIVHPVFTLLGLNDGNASVGEGLVVIALYVALAVTALAIDRRALLVSALAYVLYALTTLFKQLGAVELNVALTALVIGSALLMLSAFWHQARAAIVARLPVPLQSKLPSIVPRLVTA